MKTMTAKYPPLGDQFDRALRLEAESREQRRAYRVAREAAEKLGHIHLRVPMSRKSRYVRAARRMALGLSEWMTRTCDAASVEEGRQ